MLDIRLIREQPDYVRQQLARFAFDTTLVDRVLAFDEARRTQLRVAEELKAQRNTVSKAISKMTDAAERAVRIAEMRAAESISLRVMNLGGIANTLRAVALCEAAGLQYRFGAIFGSRVMHAHTLHLASTLRAPAFAHEFSEFSLFLDDPFEGLTLERGSVRVPHGPGTGMTLRSAES